MAHKAKAEAQDLQATLSLLKADLANQQQVVKAQQSDLQAASNLKSQVSELAEQLQEQQKMFAAKEEQTAQALKQAGQNNERLATSNAGVPLFPSLAQLVCSSYL